MNFRTMLALALLSIWCAWMYLLQGALHELGWPRGWVPEAGLVLMLALAARMPPRRALAPIVLIALSRAAFGIDAPLVVLSGYLGAALLFLALRGLIELTDPLLAALLAALLQLALGLWWRLAQRVALSGLPGDVLEHYDARIPAALSAALVTGLLALVGSRWMTRLPGLSALTRRTA